MRRARSIEAWQHTFTTEDLHNGGAMDFQLARGCSLYRRGHGLRSGYALTKRLPKVATEMALNVLAYNMKRVMAIIGVAGLLQALAA